MMPLDVRSTGQRRERRELGDVGVIFRGKGNLTERSESRQKGDKHNEDVFHLEGLEGGLVVKRGRPV